MKKCVWLASLAGLLCLLTPDATLAATSNGRQMRATATVHATVRKAPRPPKRDQVQGRSLDGSVTLIQLISTRRSDHQRRHHRITPPDSTAQVLASWDEAERDNSALLTARSVDSLPPHLGATHLCI